MQQCGHLQEEATAQAREKDVLYLVLLVRCNEVQKRLLGKHAHGTYIRLKIVSLGVMAGTRLSHRELSIWLVVFSFAYDPHGRTYELNVFANRAIGYFCDLLHLLYWYSHKSS